MPTDNPFSIKKGISAPQSKDPGPDVGKVKNQYLSGIGIICAKTIQAHENLIILPPFVKGGGGGNETF